jgi:hypothetical protein
MKVLIIVPSYPKLSGVDMHRLFVPHNLMGTLFPECEISLINEMDHSGFDKLQIDIMNFFQKIIDKKSVTEGELLDPNSLRKLFMIRFVIVIFEMCFFLLLYE